MKLGTGTGSLVNHLLSRGVIGEPTPTVGMGATLLSWTDRNPATIVEVTDKYIAVQEDRARRVDSNGMSEAQEYEYTPNPDATRLMYRKDRKGLWVRCDLNPATGRLVNVRGAGLRIGEREKYYDFSF